MLGTIHQLKTVPGRINILQVVIDSYVYEIKIPMWITIEHQQASLRKFCDAMRVIGFNMNVSVFKTNTALQSEAAPQTPKTEAQSQTPKADSEATPQTSAVQTPEAQPIGVSHAGGAGAQPPGAVPPAPLSSFFRSISLTQAQQRAIENELPDHENGTNIITHALLACFDDDLLRACGLKRVQIKAWRLQWGGWGYGGAPHPHPHV